MNDKNAAAGQAKPHDGPWSRKVESGFRTGREDREGDVGVRGAGALAKQPDRQESHDQPEQGWRGFFAWMGPRRPNRVAPMRL